MIAQLDLFATPPAPPRAAPALMPLTSDDRDAAAALAAVAAGHEDTVARETMRHLVRIGLLHVTLTRIMITKEGRALLERAGVAA